MQVKANLGATLKRALSRTDLRQKEVAISTKTACATFSDHVQGSPARFDKAIDYHKFFKNERFVDEANKMLSEYSYLFLGFLKSMDGKLSEVSEAELDIFQQIESDERKSCKPMAQRLMVESKVRDLDREEMQVIRNYGLEMLDEIIVELTITFKAFEITGMDIQDAIKQKMPEWQCKKYMRRY